MIIWSILADEIQIGPNFLRITKSIPISHFLRVWRSALPLSSKVNADFSVSQGQLGSLVDFLSFFPFFSLIPFSSALPLKRKCSSESPFSCFLHCSLKGSVGKDTEPLTINYEAFQPNSVKFGLRQRREQSSRPVPWAGYRFPQRFTAIRCVATDPVIDC